MTRSSAIAPRLKAGLFVSLFAVGTLVLGNVFTSVEALSAEAAPPKTNFKARDATRFRENPDLTKYGLPNITVVYEDSLFPSGASRSQPNTTYIANNTVPKVRRQNPDIIVIDIEAWPLKAGLSEAEVTATINKFKKVIGVFRRELPTVKIGIYLLLPERNWLAPCGDPGKAASRTKQWHDRNLKLRPLADAVDIIFPSLYTFYNDPKCWDTYAAANIKEARMYGKPVWAFLWMKIHTTGANIPASFWRQQLNTVYRLADGVVVWSKASSTERWSYTAPWWVQTADFLKDNKLAP